MRSFLASSITRAIVTFLSFVALGALASCNWRDGNAETGPVVLAASSLQESLAEAANDFAAASHSRPVLAFAATSALARQVERGAPADIFIAADADWMDLLDQAGLLAAGSRNDLLTNRLVVAAPRAVGSAARDPFAGGGRIAMAGPDAVPAGRYARAALQSLGRWDAVQARIVPAENVRAALALVERGEVDHAIVYATDALASKEVEAVFHFPENGHSPIVYPAALLAASRHPRAAEFLAFLNSEEGRAIFRRHGFGIVP